MSIGGEVMVCRIMKILQLRRQLLRLLCTVFCQLRCQVECIRMYFILQSVGGILLPVLCACLAFFATVWLKSADTSVYTFDAIVT